MTNPLPLAQQADSAAVFTVVTGDSCSAMELLDAGHYHQVSNPAHLFVRGRRFRLSTVVREVDLVLIEFQHDLRSEEVLAEFSRRGLERPTEEDALLFGEKFPDEQRKYELV